MTSSILTGIATISATSPRPPSPFPHLLHSLERILYYDTIQSEGNLFSLLHQQVEKKCIRDLWQPMKHTQCHLLCRTSHVVHISVNIHPTTKAAQSLDTRFRLYGRHHCH